MIGDANDESTLLSEAKEQLRSSEEGWRETRERALTCFKFLAGEDHWPAEIRAAREAQQRPCLTVNKLPKFVAQIVGQYRLANMSVQISPVDSKADVTLASVYEGLTRAVQYESVAQVAYRIALQHAATGGFGWYRVAREYESDDGWDQVLRVRPIYNPFSVYLDPRSVAHDLSDARFLFVSDDISEKEFEKAFPDADLASISAEGSGDRRMQWRNSADKTVRVCEWWTRDEEQEKLVMIGIPGNDQSIKSLSWPKEPEEEAKVQQEMQLAGYQVIGDRQVKRKVIKQSLVSGGHILKPATKWPGRFMPIIPVYGEELYYEGERRLWGVIWNALDPQRIYNFQWTSAVESVALQPKAPYMLTPKQLNNGEQDNTAAWNRVNSGTPYVLYNPDPNAPIPQRQMPPTVPTGMLELCDRASYDLMETTGIYQSSLGEKSNEKSGAAIEARQRQGDSAVSAWPDNLRLSMEHCGRILIDLYPTVYDTQRTLRILGEDLETSDVVELDLSSHDAARGKYDVVVKVGPSWATRRSEMQSGVLELMKVMSPDKVDMALPILLKYTDNPAAKELAKRFSEAEQEAANRPPKSPVTETLNYKDAPPDVQREIEKQAGLEPSRVGLPGQQGPYGPAGPQMLPHKGAPPPSKRDMQEIQGMPPGASPIVEQQYQD